MKKSLLLAMLCLHCILIVAQDGGCYVDKRTRGIALMSKGRWDDAVVVFKSAQTCPDKPDDNDLAAKIKECQDKKNQEIARKQREENARREREAENARRQQEAENQRRQREAQVAQAALEKSTHATVQQIVPLSQGRWKSLMKNVMRHANKSSDNNAWAYRGQVKNDKFSGLGIYYWPDNEEFYIGEFADGDFNGEAIMLLGDMDSHFDNCVDAVAYMGTFKDDAKEGQGTCYDKYGALIYFGDFSEGSPVDDYPHASGFEDFKFRCIEYTNGAMYLGETIDDERHGLGIFFWKSGNAWFGKWEDGERNGAGILLYADGRMEVGSWEGDDKISDSYIPSVDESKKGETDPLYLGEWREAMEKALDNANRTFDNGDLYKGELLSNSLSGLGVYKWKGGSYHWGEFANGDFNGMAIKIATEGYTLTNCPDCSYYVGDYTDDEMDGKGTCYDKYGNLIYYGDFKNGKPVEDYPLDDSSGYSAYKFECIKYDNGNMYVGETYNGKRHGRGIYLWPSGNAWYGPWSEGSRAGYGILLNHDGTKVLGTWEGDERK